MNESVPMYPARPYFVDKYILLSKYCNLCQLDSLAIIHEDVGHSSLLQKQPYDGGYYDFSGSGYVSPKVSTVTVSMI